MAHSVTLCRYVNPRLYFVENDLDRLFTSKCIHASDYLVMRFTTIPPMNGDLNHDKSGGTWFQKTFTEQPGGSCPRGKAHRLYYDILGVDPNCELAEIRDAYLRLAREFHPDKNEDGGEAFQTISKIYNVLSSEQSRIIYDSLGEKGLELYAKTPSIAMKFSHFANIFGFGDSDVFGTSKNSANPTADEAMHSDHDMSSVRELDQQGAHRAHDSPKQAQCTEASGHLKPSLNDLARAAERETELLGSALRESAGGASTVLTGDGVKPDTEQNWKSNCKGNVEREMQVLLGVSPSTPRRQKRRAKRKPRERTGMQYVQPLKRGKRAKEESAMEEEENSTDNVQHCATQLRLQELLSEKINTCISPLLFGDFPFTTSKRQLCQRRPTKQQSAPLLYSSIPQSVFTKLENANALELLEQIKQVKKMSETSMALISSEPKVPTGRFTAVTSSIKLSQSQSFFHNVSSCSASIACATNSSVVHNSFTEQVGSHYMTTRFAQPAAGAKPFKTLLGNGANKNSPQASSLVVPSVSVQTSDASHLTNDALRLGEEFRQSCKEYSKNYSAQAAIQGNSPPLPATSGRSSTRFQTNPQERQTGANDAVATAPLHKVHAPLVVEAFVEHSVLSDGGPVHISYRKKHYCSECKSKRGNFSCAACAGKGFVSENATLSIRLPPRSQSGQHMTIKGRGNVYSEGENGDLLVVLKEQR